jgi:hypothetical protein
VDRQHPIVYLTSGITAPAFPGIQRKNMQDTPAHRFDRKFPNLKGCIFIVTYGRTGSTLLQSLVSTIPGCVIRGENHNVMEPILGAASRARKTRGTWGKAEQPLSHPWYGADAIRPVVFANTLVDAFVDHVLCPPRDARWIGFKEIRYNGFDERFGAAIDFMRAHFKNAHFIFNTRRKEDVAKSAWWAKWEYEDVETLIDNMDRRFAEYHAAHPDYTTMTSYESFSTDPQALAPLFGKLGEALDEAKIKTVLGQKLTH